MRFCVMSFQWLSIIYCWVDHGNMTEMWCIMGGRTHTLWKKMVGHMLLSIKDKEVKPEMNNTVLLMSGKELLKEFKKKEDTQFIVVRKPIIVLNSTRIDDLLEEIQGLLEEFVDIVVDELPYSLPPIESISHHIDLILGAIFPNKAAYRLMP
jgi:hypothetical protein